MVATRLVLLLMIGSATLVACGPETQEPPDPPLAAPQTAPEVEPAVVPPSLHDDTVLAP